MPAAARKASRRPRGANAQRRRAVISQPEKQADDREDWRTLAHVALFCFTVAVCAFAMALLRSGGRGG